MSDDIAADAGGDAGGETSWSGGVSTEAVERVATGLGLPSGTNDAGSIVNASIARQEDEVQDQLTNSVAFGRGGSQSRWGGGGGSSWDGRSGGAEFEDLATVQRFAQEIVALGEGSDFVQVIKGCGTLHEMIRDFGGDMNRGVREFVEAAICVERDGIALRDQAAQVAGLANDLSGAGV